MIKTDLLQVSDRTLYTDHVEEHLRQNLGLEAREVLEVVDRPLLVVAVGFSVRGEQPA